MSSHKSTKRLSQRVNDSEFPKHKAASLAKGDYDYWDGDRRVCYGGYKYLEGDGKSCTKNADTVTCQIMQKSWILVVEKVIYFLTF